MRHQLGIARRIASVLESGADVAGGFAPGLAGAMSTRWAERARVVKPLDWYAPGRALITVGGATLGGDGKTRLALACAAHLAERGVRVALVGHGHRATPGDARVVAPTDPVELVGDEALVLARRLADLGIGERVPVIVAPRRTVAAVELAFRHADVVVLDGTLQVAPVRATLALLAQSADAPWGAAGLCPPRGDLRASRARLLAAADLQVELADAEPEVRVAGEPRLSLATFAEPRAPSPVFASVCSPPLARPERIVRRLARARYRAAGQGRGRRPRRRGLGSPPHGGPAHPGWPARTALDMWLATDKCSAGLTFPPGGAVLAELVPLHGSGEILPPRLVARLAELAAAP